MNYYRHHIGDYDANTAHLTWLEDMAYTRLMRLYYRREQPIPDAEIVVCGMSMGYARADAAENTLVTEREPVSRFATFIGF